MFAIALFDANWSRKKSLFRFFRIVCKSEVREGTGSRYRLQSGRHVCISSRNLCLSWLGNYIAAISVITGWVSGFFWFQRALSLQHPPVRLFESGALFTTLRIFLHFTIAFVFNVVVQLSAHFALELRIRHAFMFRLFGCKATHAFSPNPNSKYCHFNNKLCGIRWKASRWSINPCRK